MLIDMIAYIQKEKIVSLEMLSRAFKIQTDALVPILNRLIQKKWIYALTNQPRCQTTCGGCQVKPMSYYSVLKGDNVSDGALSGDTKKTGVSGCC